MKQAKQAGSRRVRALDPSAIAQATGGSGTQPQPWSQPQPQPWSVAPQSGTGPTPW